MPQSCPDPTLDVAGDEMLVTLRGTSYAVTYLKRGGTLGLLAKDFIQDDDPCITRDLRRVPGSGLEGRHRQGERARLDSVRPRRRTQ